MKKIIIPVVFLFTIVIVIFFGFFIKVKIDCRSLSGECSPEIYQNLESMNGKPIFVAKREISKKLKSNFLISNFTIQFKLPDILRVYVLVKKPSYAILNSNNVFDLVESGGTVVSQASESSLPHIKISGDLPAIGQKVNDEYLLALKLIDGVNKMYQTSLGMIETDTLLVDLPQGIRVIFPLTGYSREMLLGSLRLIYSNIQSGENKNSYSQIDLRYRNPVLR